jgi:hypothetical protein
MATIPQQSMAVSLSPGADDGEEDERQRPFPAQLTA